MRMYNFDADRYMQDIIQEEAADYYLFTKDEVMKMMILEGSKIKSLDSIDKYDVATRYLKRVVNAYLLKQQSSQLQHSKELYQTLTGRSLTEDYDETIQKWENQLIFMSRLYYTSFDDTIMNNEKSGLGLSAKSRIKKTIQEAGFDGSQKFLILKSNNKEENSQTDKQSKIEINDENIRILTLTDEEIQIIEQLLKDKEGVQITKEENDQLQIEFESMLEEDNETNNEINLTSSLKSKVEQTKTFGSLQFF